MPSQRELMDLLRSELLTRLAPLGWAMTGPAGTDVLLGIARTVDSGLDATATVHRPPVAWGGRLIVSGLDVGVGYGPLRELSTLLDAYGRDIYSSTIEADGSLSREFDEHDQLPAWPVGGDLPEGEEPDGEQHPGRFVFTAGNPDEVQKVAKQLADIVIEHGCRIADRYTDVDELIADMPDLAAAALLSVTGRPEEATAILDRMGSGSDSLPNRRRCVYQLRRWISSGCDHSLLPPAPPPQRLPRLDKLSFTEIWKSGQKHKANKNGALKATRDRARDLGRAQQLTILAEELEAYDVQLSPIELELEVDGLWDTTADQWEAFAKGVITAGQAGLKLIRAMRGDEPEAQELEDRVGQIVGLAAPDPAFFEVPADGRQVGIDLNDGIDATLDEVYELTWPKVRRTAPIQEAWLTVSEAGEVVVHVAEWEIGTIPAATAESFEQAMREAAFREEFPKLPARIARLGEPPRYIVEIEQPVPW